MILAFYTVPVILIENASYLGPLIEQEQKDINVNMSNISKVSILLPSEFIKYNYIKLIRTDGSNYYYKLASWTYYIEDQTTFHYEIDIIRTLKDKDMLNFDVYVQRYSNLLNMSEEQKNYFWRTQDTKLSSNVKQEFIDTTITYSESIAVQAAWSKTKWVYIWLQPRMPDEVTITDNDDLPHKQKYQYKFTKRAQEEVLTVPIGELILTYSAVRVQNGNVNTPISILPSTGNVENDRTLGEALFYGYPVNQLYYVSANDTYYRFVEQKLNSGSQQYVGDFVTRKFIKVDDYKYGEYDESHYYLINLPPVAITDVPNQLYCLVLPTNPIRVFRRYGNAYKDKLWSADAVLPYLFDINTENNWGEYIADIKISAVPPFDLADSKNFIGTTSGAPSLYIGPEVPGDNFDPIKALFERSKATDGNNKLIINPLFLPVLRYKPNELYRLNSTFKLPEVNKENTVYKKYLLSVVEQRKELDLPLLKTDKATTLYYYEDISPGRTNLVIGYAPEGNPKDIVYYLIHSPSSLFMTRDTTLPTFTSNYQAYLANNKNFMQQAELQRNSDLAQSLIQQSSSVIGATVVQSTVKGYSAAGAIAGAAAGAINAGIKYGVEKQNFNWMVDNHKSAPGSFKAASATLMFMLNLDIYRVWIEVYRSNEFDITLYEGNIMAVGYDYSLFRYNLLEIIEDAFTGELPKKYLQATIVGLSDQLGLNLPLLLILQDQLTAGINILT